jgi:hypothetical protein
VNSPVANHRELAHYRDRNHDHNPPDGSHWELLCLYCHDTNTSGNWERPEQ